MNKTISINISGFVFNIEEQAYDILKDYLDSIKQYFKPQEGGADIIADIEARIAELFQQQVNEEKAAITLNDVQTVIKSMGQPFEMVDEEEAAQEEPKTKSGRADYEPREKKVFRDSEEKVLGGVCSGLAAYFGIDALWVRLIFVLVAFWGGGGVLIYIILWIAIPEAVTTADRLRMRGKPVNVSNIEKSIRDGAKEIGDDINEFIKNAENQKNFKNGTRQATNVVQRFINALVQIIGFILKSALKFGAVIAVVVGITVLTVMVLVFFASFSVSGFLFSDVVGMVIPDGTQKVLLLVALFLAFLIPTLVVLIRAFQVLLKQGSISKPYLIGAFVTWLVCIIFLFAQGTVLLVDLKSSATINSELELKDATRDRYYISSLEPREAVTHHFWGRNTFSADGFYFDNGQFFYKNVNLKVERSNDQEYHLITRYYSKGRDYNNAVENAKEVVYEIDQSDSSILLSPYLSIHEGAYRWQEVTVILLVPEGKEVVFQNYTRDITNYIGGSTGFYSNYANKVFKMSSNGLEHVAAVASESGPDGLISYSMSGFNAVDIDSDENIRIELVEGKDYKVEVAQELYQHDGFKVYMRGKELRIRVDDSWNWELPDVPIHIRVECPDFDEINCSGSSESFISSSRPGDLELNIYGASKSTVNGYFDDLDIKVAGVADIILTGTADNFDAEVTGSSKIHGMKMVARRADVELHGICKTELHVTDILRVEANGSSSLTYKGKPTLIQNVSGLSKITSIDN